MERLIEIFSHPDVTAVFVIVGVALIGTMIVAAVMLGFYYITGGSNHAVIKSFKDDISHDGSCRAYAKKLKGIK